MDGMSDIERLVAIEDIRMLKARRDRALDDKDWDTYREIHAPDHWSRHEGGDWKGADKMIEALKLTMAGVTSAHHSHTHEITFESSTKATCIWAMEDNLYWKQGDDDHWLRGFGYYHETVEKRDGRWVFTSRGLKRRHVMTSPGANRGKPLAEPVKHVR